MLFSNKKVLVTGGTGFVGRHIVRQLEENGACVRIPLHHRPLTYDCEGVETVHADLARWEDCREASRGVDYVIHAAGAAGAAGVTGSDQMDGITLNLILTTQVLKAAWAEGVRGVLVFGSSTGYPAYDRAVTEDEMWLDEPHPSYFGYGWMRRYLEKLAEYVSRESTCRVIVVRPSAVYGSWDNFSDKTSHVIPALIMRAVRKENPFLVWGRGNEVRDFVHVTDFAKGCLLALEKCSHFEMVNIGAGRSYTIAEIVSTILDAAEHRGASVVFDHTKPATIPCRMLDISKARRLLGFEPEVGLEQGIRDTVQWYTRNVACKARSLSDG
jgi:GDP-L-fucose synthase